MDKVDMQKNFGKLNPISKNTTTLSISRLFNQFRSSFFLFFLSLVLVHSFSGYVFADEARNQKSHLLYKSWFDESYLENQVTYVAKIRQGAEDKCKFYSYGPVTLIEEDYKGIIFNKEVKSQCIDSGGNDEKYFFPDNVAFVECKSGYVWKNTLSLSIHNKHNTNCISNPCSGHNIYDSAKAQCEPLIEPKTLKKMLGTPSGCLQEGNPCDASTGNKFQTEVDFTSPTLNFIRYYNSMIDTNDVVGKHWSHNYSSRLVINTETVLVQSGSGKGLTFDHPAEGAASSDGDVFSKLIKNTDGSWEYHTIDNRVEIYNASGQLVTLRALNGLETQLGYYADGTLHTMTDAFGRTLTITYNAEGKIDTVTTPAEQVIQYHYTDLRLVKVTYPDQTTRQYLYKNNLAAQMNGIIDENGHQYVRWDYDSQGRAKMSEHVD